MKLWLYTYLNEYKHKSIFNFNYIGKNYLFFIIKMLTIVLFYKCCYLLAYNLYYKPYKNKLIYTAYKDEFHPDLQGYLLEYSWLRSNHYEDYILILVKARNKAHNDW